MSWEALRWVWLRDITPASRKLVAVCLADRANEDGECWPSHKNLAERCNLSVESVRAHLRALEEEGVLVKESRTRENGSQQSNRYAIKPLPDDRPVAGDQGGSSGQPGGGGSGQPPLNPQEEPPEEPPHSAREDGKLFDTDPVREVHDHYKATVPGKADAKLTQTTRKLIKRALDERPIEKLKLAINGLAISQHHLDGGWTGIHYAIGKVKATETQGDRIDMMAAKAPAQSNSPDGTVTVEELLRTVPSDRHDIIRHNMSLVIAAIKRGDRAQREEELVRRYPGVEPIIDASRGEAEFKGWRRVS